MLVLLLFSSGVINAKKYDAIEVEGNLRIEKNLIIEKSGLKINVDYSAQDLDKATTKIFAPGYFSEINFKEAGNTLIICVKESPVIRKIVFSNTSLDRDMVLANIPLKEGSIYSYHNLKESVFRISNGRASAGQLFISINPKIRYLSNNRVDIDFDIAEGKIARIQSINLVGNKAFNSSFLRLVLNSKADTWYNVFFFSQSIYSPAAIEHDRDTLVKFYKSKGFLDVKITNLLTEYLPSENGFHITFCIEEGARYTVDKISLKSEIDSLDLAKLKSLMSIKEKDDANILSLEQHARILKRLVYEEGENAVNIRFKLNKNKKTSTVDVEYNIKETPKYVIANIFVEGNTKTKADVILSYLTLNSGDVFSDIAAANTQYALLRLGFFDSAQVIPKPNGKDGEVDLFIRVKEKASTAQVRPSLNYKGDRGLEFSINYREINFLGTGNQLSFDGTRNKNNKNISVNFSNPHAFERNLLMGINAGWNKNSADSSGFSTTNLSTGLIAKYKTSDFSSQYWKLSFGKSEVEVVSSKVSELLKAEQGDYAITKLATGWNYDTTDNPLMPTKGVGFNIGMELNDFANKDGLGFRLSTSAEKVWSLSESGKMTLVVSGQVVYLGKFDTTKHIRIFDSLHLGGASFRGFDKRGIGPRDFSSLAKTSLGGNFMYKGTVQLNFPIGLPEEWRPRAFVFSDIGAVINQRDFSANKHVKNDDDLRLSVGFGFRLITPYGPCGITWAYPLFKTAYDETKTRYLELGGNLL